MRVISGQLSLDFSEPKPKASPCEKCLEWLHGRGRLDADDAVRRLFREFGQVEAWDRAKALDNRGKATAGQVANLGLFDHEVDYHVLWDRSWAIMQGVDPDRAAGIERWDYAGKRPVWGCVREEHGCFFKPCTEAQGVRCCAACAWFGGCTSRCYVIGR